MTQAETMAAFIANACFDQLSEDARLQLKVRVLDSLGCAIGAIGHNVPRLIRAQVDEFGGSPLATLIGGGRAAPDRAALYNSALVRYLDFNDSYLAKGETCHPSDNLGSVLAASEYSRASGRDFLTALAVAYQVQCRLSDEAPVRSKGFDHTTQGSYAVAAGVSKALKLDPARTANALAISGTAFNALRVTRTGAISNWKGLAYPNTAFGATHAAFLAMRGITGPLEVFEGNKGFIESISGPFQIDWPRENLERVTRTIVKRYNAEIHSQSAIEAILDLKSEYKFDPPEIENIAVEIFDVAYNIIGGGEEGSKTEVGTKEAADHSLPYLLAVAVLDGQVMPAQFAVDRIRRPDVQSLLRKIRIEPSAQLSARFPQEMPCTIAIQLRDGRLFTKQKTDYEGFTTRPARWDSAVAKFQMLSESFTTRETRKRLAESVFKLESEPIERLIDLLREGVRNHG